jgi:hypothetical protein
LTRVCMDCGKEMGEKCPRCGGEQPTPVAAVASKYFICRMGHTFEKGAGGETHGICGACSDLRNLEMWEGAAFRAVEKIANSAEYFTADEVDLTQIARARDKRALGGVMLKARNLGLIERTNTFRIAARVGSHASPRRVWKSNLFAERDNVHTV